MIRTSAVAATALVGLVAFPGLTSGGQRRTALVVAPPSETAILEVLGKIRDEGLYRSQVMATAKHLTDHIGARLTGSPAMRRANEWTRDELAGWGLANARLEPFEFGEGWSVEEATVRITAPVETVVFGLPKAWTPGTVGADGKQGPIRGWVRRATLESDEDLAKLLGKPAASDGTVAASASTAPVEDKPPADATADSGVEGGAASASEDPAAVSDLRGAILLIGEEPDPVDCAKPLFDSYDDGELVDVVAFDIPGEKEGEPYRTKFRKRWRFWQGAWDQLAAAGVQAVVEASSFHHGVVRLTGGGNFGIADAAVGLPQVVVSTETYDRMLRLLDEPDTAERRVELEIDVRTTFHRDDPTAWNTLAELPGSDLADQVVMLGAHLDSWHAGTGATDNAAGVAVAMEAMRILAKVGAKPRRTVRVALWSGEEQGLLGSKAYVAEHFASRPVNGDPTQADLPLRMRDEGWPLTPKPAHAGLSVYFNLDNGGGRVRGIWGQENLAAKPVLARYIAPLDDLGVTTITLEKTGSTDHMSFDRVGLPGFQLLQDPRDYGTRTHHSHLDTFGYLDREDLIQAAVVMASLVYQAAMDETPMPRKPLPVESKD